MIRRVSGPAILDRQCNVDVFPSLCREERNTNKEGSRFRVFFSTFLTLLTLLSLRILFWPSFCRPQPQAFAWLHVLMCCCKNKGGHFELRSSAVVCWSRPFPLATATERRSILKNDKKIKRLKQWHATIFEEQTQKAI
jgi:hypothetical protein